MHTCNTLARDAPVPYPSTLDLHDSGSLARNTLAAWAESVPTNLFHFPAPLVVSARSCAEASHHRRRGQRARERLFTCHTREHQARPLEWHARQGDTLEILTREKSVFLSSFCLGGPLPTISGPIFAGQHTLHGIQGGAESEYEGGAGETAGVVGSFMLQPVGLAVPVRLGAAPNSAAARLAADRAVPRDARDLLGFLHMGI